MTTPADAALSESAALAWAQAPALCRRDPATRASCAWHHGLWPTLRLLGLVTEPALHGEFLRGALAALAPAGERPRLLLSGAADHALLVQVLAARGLHGARVTVLDICETPLMLNRWFAQHAGAEIVTRRADILDFADAEPFDAVCTHAFLGNFDARQRAALAAKWHSLLRPGGCVVTVNRLRPDRGPGRVAFTADQARAYRERALRAASSREHDLPMSATALASAADDYASRQTIYPLQTAGELRALFEAAGFAIEHLSVAPLQAAARAGINVPTMPSADDYAHLIAVRR
jgi:SAM-dependent methyltransferase